MSIIDWMDGGLVAAPSRLSLLIFAPECSCAGVQAARV